VAKRRRKTAPQLIRRWCWRAPTNRDGRFRTILPQRRVGRRDRAGSRGCGELTDIARRKNWASISEARPVRSAFAGCAAGFDFVTTWGMARSRGIHHRRGAGFAKQLFQLNGSRASSKHGGGVSASLAQRPLQASTVAGPRYGSPRRGRVADLAPPLWSVAKIAVWPAAVLTPIPRYVRLAMCARCHKSVRPGALASASARS
jgi:hypothetical protein